MKNVFYYALIISIVVPGFCMGQPLERMCQSLPTFSGYAGVKGVDGVLTVGIFSDEQSEVEKKTLKMFQDIKSWNKEQRKELMEYKEIKVVSLTGENLDQFEGQIIWVLDADASLEKLKEKSSKGTYTTAVQDDKFEDYLFLTIFFENKSDDPSVEKWRAVKITANCEISPLRFPSKITKKPYFSGKSCE